MVENQLRPNKINNPIILDLFKQTKKENFLFDSIKKNSYFDSDINIKVNRGYLKNLHIAQLIQFADIKKHHTVLHIGGLTGYVSSMLSKLCKELIVLEIHKELIIKFKENIENLNLKNIKIYNSKFEDGFQNKAPYDVIFMDNPVTKIPKLIKDQIKNHLGKIIMIKKTHDYLCKAYKIIKNSNNFNEEYLFDVFCNYELYTEKREFVF